MRRSMILVLILASLRAGSDLAAQGCLGCLDFGFGNAGKVIVGFDLGQSNRDAANSSLRVPGNGTIISVGQVEMGVAGDSDFGLIALREDGSPDSTFGFLGTTTIAMDFTSGGQDIARDVTLVPWNAGLEWRLAVVGEVERASVGDTDFGVALVRPDGSLENLASGGGKVAVYFDLGDDLSDMALAVATDPSGRIVVAGPVDSGPGDTDWGFARLLADLTLDTTFDGNGKTVIDVAGLAIVRDVLVQPDGKILAIGARDLTNRKMVIARLNVDGSLDTGFGVAGFVLNPLIPVEGFALALWPDGRIFGVGQWSGLIAFTQLLPDGTVNLLSSYMPPPECDHTHPRAVALDPVGRPVIGAESFCNGSKNFFAVRLDLPASSDGPWVVDFDLGGTFDDRLTGLLLQPDGKIVMTGRVQNASGDIDFGVARLWTEILFADGFESGSISEWTSSS